MGVIEGVQTHGICVYSLIIIIVHYIMVCTGLQRMKLQFMRPHISSPAESLAADIAVMVFDARMGYHVLGEITGGVETFLT